VIDALVFGGRGVRVGHSPAGDQPNLDGGCGAAALLTRHYFRRVPARLAACQCGINLPAYSVMT